MCHVSEYTQCNIALQILSDVLCAVNVTGLSAFIRDKKDPNTYVCVWELSEFTCYKAAKSDDSHETNSFLNVYLFHSTQYW